MQNKTWLNIRSVCYAIVIVILVTLQQRVMGALPQQSHYTPPAIPPVNTEAFKQYVRTYHTFPTPYGYEPYRDANGHELTFPLKTLNQHTAYIPVTFYCQSANQCPIGIYANYNAIDFTYAHRKETLHLEIKTNEQQPKPFIAYYYPNNPTLYAGVDASGFYDLGKGVKKGDALVTVLMSQAVLQQMSEKHNGQQRGQLSTGDRDIDLPLSLGDEYLTVGTTLGLMGLGQASGVEFSETVTQTTGETYSTQVQIGFSLNVAIEDQVTVGGGALPVSDSFKFGINTTLSSLLSNGLQIANQNSVSRTYMIKPGINDTYYWAIYQLLYSYRIEAPVLAQALREVEQHWGHQVRCVIGGNDLTQDQQTIGQLVPPEAPNLVSDITVGVAVPIDPSHTHSFAARLKRLD